MGFKIKEVLLIEFVDLYSNTDPWLGISASQNHWRIKKIHGQNIRILYNDFPNDNIYILNKSGKAIMKMKHSQNFALETFKSLSNLNPDWTMK